MKPTYGRVSRYGIVAFASSLDQIGPFARDARDAAALLHAVAGRDDRDSTSSPEPVPATLTALPTGDDAAAGALRGKRLGLPREYFVAGMEPGVEARVREAVAALEAAGATVEEVSLPHTDYGLATYYIVAPAEASANLARYDGIRYGPRLGDGDVLANYLATRGRGFGAEVKRRIMLGTYALSAGYYDAYYLKAQKVRTLIKGDFDALWAQGFDALVAPTSPTVAFRLGARLADPVAMYLSDACTLPVNMAGLPGVSIPCGLSDGLPVGLQLIGAAWSEARCSGWRAATRRSPRTPTGGRSSRPRSRAPRIHRSRPRPSGWPVARARSSGRSGAGSAAVRQGPDAVRLSPMTTTDASPRIPLSERALSERVRSVPPSGIRRFFDIAATMDDVISLGVGEPDFDTPRVIVEAGVESLREGRTHYTSNFGTLELRRALARPPRGTLRRRLRPGDRDHGHGRRLGGGGPRAPGDVRPG